jgi:hypothetical protein
VTTLDSGATAEAAVSQVGQPQWPANGLTVSGPLFRALVASPATTEAQTKPTMADPTLAQAELAAFAVTATISDQAVTPPPPSFYAVTAGQGLISRQVDTRLGTEWAHLESSAEATALRPVSNKSA